MVIGAGAVGGSLASLLAEAGVPVVLVGRGENARRIAESGLRLRTPQGTRQVRLDVVDSADAVDLTWSDVLLMTVKAQDVEAALAAWAWRPVSGGSRRQAFAADLPIVTFQNGLVGERSALRRFERVIGATIVIGASHLSPGEVVLRSTPPVAGIVWIGRYPSGVDVEQDAIAADLTKAGLLCIPVVDSSAHKAAKLLGSVGNVVELFDGTGALRSAMRDRLRTEALSVLRAAGTSLPPGDRLDPRGARLTLGEVEDFDATGFSTWQSFARGASSEVDFLNGEIVLIARQVGVAAPLNVRAQRLAAGLDELGARPLSELLGPVASEEEHPGRQSAD
ncbi:NAD(P)-binding domain-containing protein [Nocardioides carbamazepini]|uniref:ketopantoate reductase family protein n=1 Tax=Nocardioides carbamazepini TaxID=2854259 RepID=UPI002149EAAD|nr:2-dehydropantoate 2-reductase N-terminal domain-containing protein [Nocardioides carbamazepini]MCR1782368.1 NAD(P)-binding domain-containing protein [Nocardioides carbamazepini]